MVMVQFETKILNDAVSHVSKIETLRGSLVTWAYIAAILSLGFQQLIYFVCATIIKTLFEGVKRAT